MSNIKSLIFSAILLFCSISVCNAQHLTFLDIPLTGTIDNFQQQLYAKGYKADKRWSSLVVSDAKLYKGQFLGHQADIHIYYKKDNQVYRAKAVVTCENQDAAKQLISDFRHQLAAKYPKAQLTNDKSKDGSPVVRIKSSEGEIDLFMRPSLNDRYNVQADFWDAASSNGVSTDKPSIHLKAPDVNDLKEKQGATNSSSVSTAITPTRNKAMTKSKTKSKSKSKSRRTRRK